MTALYTSPWPCVALIVTVSGWVLVHFRKLGLMKHAITEALKDSTPEQRPAILEAAPAVLHELGSDHGRPGPGLHLSLGTAKSTTGKSAAQKGDRTD
jgi:hypothetical protein